MFIESGRNSLRCANASPKDNLNIKKDDTEEESLIRHKLITLSKEPDKFPILEFPKEEGEESIFLNLILAEVLMFFL